MPPNGKRFPAEWERHSATWMTWPCNPDTWPRNLSAAQGEFETLVHTIAEVELVNLLANQDSVAELSKRFGDHERIQIIDIPTNDCWIRDYGPTFVLESRAGESSKPTPIGVDWKYDGWGEKYPPFDLDQRVATRIIDHLNFPSVKSKIVLEGGSIDSNGQGCVLTTSLCQSTRNPDTPFNELQRELHNCLGTNRLIILESVEIEGDDTDGHIDQVARFISEDKVIVSERQLSSASKSLSQNGFEMVTLSDPEQVRMFQSVVPASYTNFYIANEIVVVPQFGVPQDSAAIGIIGELFADRHVIGLPSRELAVGLGSFHCLTQQQPA